MKCNVIADLLPLYVDECCSEESSKLVREHLETCEACRKTHSAMGQSGGVSQTKVPKMKMRRVSDWKASVLQSVMLYFSFALIVFGVIFEGSTPQGSENGLWASALIIPATANLLASANWYFIRLYKSGKQFSICSSLITLAMVLGGYSWIWLHYAGSVSLTEPLVIAGIVLSLVFVVSSKILSGLYAKLLGRE